MAIPFRSKGQKENLEVIEDNTLFVPPEENISFEEPTPLLKFILKHLNLVIAGFVLFVLIAIVVGVWSWYSDRQENIAQTELGHILVKPISTEQFEELEQFVKTVPSSMKKGVLLQMAFAAVELQNWNKAADYYGYVYKEDPKGITGILAGFNQADILQKTGDWQEALAILDSLEKVSSSPFLSAIYEAQAICAEQLGENAVAIAAYKKLVDELTASGNDTTFYEVRITDLSKS